MAKSNQRIGIYKLSVLYLQLRNRCFGNGCFGSGENRTKIHSKTSYCMLEYAGFCDYCMFECAILSFHTLPPTTSYSRARNAWLYVF